MAFLTAHLLIQCIQELLPGGCTSKCRALVQRATKSTTVDEPLSGAIERNAQTVHQIDHLRRPVGHLLHGRLMVEKVAAVHGVIEVFPLIIAQLPCLIITAVDSTLCTYAVRTFDRSQTEQINLHTQFSELHGGGQTCQTTTHNYYAMLCHNSNSYRFRRFSFFF